MKQDKLDQVISEIKTAIEDSARSFDLVCCSCGTIADYVPTSITTDPCINGVRRWRVTGMDTETEGWASVTFGNQRAIRYCPSCATKKGLV